MADWELKKIKKIYGENFMKLCRELFPIILEQDGKLYEIITSSFSTNSKTLYEDIINNDMVEEFKDYVFSKIDMEEQTSKTEGKTPYEILDEAGYILTECKTEEDIQAFKKYYEPDEELCTFWGGRTERFFVFWAVKKDVENIKRKDFERPKREDEYGTSVMSIQFPKHGLCTVSIKNRYNHRVNNPDATYGNNLNRIAPGLEQSFASLLEEKGIELNNSNIESEFKLRGYVVANDGKRYKYNMKINEKYYCPGNIVIENGEPRILGNSEQQILIDYFILDLKDKTIRPYDPMVEDCFINGLQNINKIQVENDKEEKGKRIVTIEKEGEELPIVIEIDKDNQIIEYKNESIKRVRNNFLRYNRSMRKIYMPNLECTGDEFLKKACKLVEVNLPKLIEVGDDVLSNACELKELNLPSLENAGNNFLNDCTKLESLNLPKLKNVKSGCLERNKCLQELSLPSIEYIGSAFMYKNKILKKFEAPKLMVAGNEFMNDNECMEEISLPNVRNVRERFYVF